MAPGSKCPIHRTLSLNYAVVLRGALELILDSGEVRTLQQGDIVVSFSAAVYTSGV
jgi:quercetin dioxygenase-like cupin family protein